MIGSDRADSGNIQPDKSLTGHSDVSVSFLPDEQRAEFERIISCFEEAWHQGQRPGIAGFLPADKPLRYAVLRELVHVDFEFRCKAGENADPAEYLAQFPELAAESALAQSLNAARERIQSHRKSIDTPGDFRATTGRDTVNPIADPGALLTFPASPPGDRNDRSNDSASSLPRQIGRYRIERLLGNGAFGLVYLAVDEQLGRPVAVKVPHARFLPGRNQAELYLAEARTLASLDHPHIVPVYDVGSTEQYPCYIVSKYVEGIDLASKLKQFRPTPNEAAELVMLIADALHYAHRHRVIHRDVKPGNVLLDGQGRPFVVDFGLALREQDLGKGPGYVGTPAYMSPEQARSEGHRVDGRSDIFSLGVVLYELLAGQRPFQGATAEEVREKITYLDPKPPRQLDDRIPRELERICLKALSKRAADRYETALLLADDLRQFVSEAASAQAREGSTVPAAGRVAGRDKPVGVDAPAGAPLSDSQALKIVPKGLRSFDEHDADFFLELMPGPRDREGFPDTIRFWKSRIQETDPDRTFTVGLIFGPSGCGKSSLIKAGLLPRLSNDVISVYLEATAEETEVRLLNGLRRCLPALPAGLDLTQSLAALRRGQGLPAGRKVLLVLDQFEQWLHARREEPDGELVQALRQCDGGRVQCLILVRDDFWMAVVRFMRELEIPLRDGQNSAAVDLFPIRHAEKILAAYGRVFGALPERTDQVNSDQQQFLKDAVLGLAQDGKVICVRLALFAEMMKGKPWTPESLKASGGIEGVGVTFLEETFSARTAPPEHRYHEKGARAVLKAMLPKAGTDLKGHRRSHVELLGLSGYAGRPKEFDDLLRILDSETRLITPTDSEGLETEGSAHEPVARGKSYQLTHDYLVTPLREWLTRKQKETRRGRAELKLAERAELWNALRENRHLPSLWEFLRIRCLTAPRTWSPAQRSMMGAANRFHGIRVVVFGALTVAAVLVPLILRESYKVQGLVGQLVRADIGQLFRADNGEVNGIIDELNVYRERAKPLLVREFEKSKPDSPQRLHLALALLQFDASQATELQKELLRVEPDQFRVVRDALRPYQSQLVEWLWSQALNQSAGDRARFQAGCALATYAANDPRWEEIDGFIANYLVERDAAEFVAWREALRPARGKLKKSLGAVSSNRQRPDGPRLFAMDALAEYADQPDELFELAVNAEVFQFPVIFKKLPRIFDDFPQYRATIIALTTSELSSLLADEAEDAAKESLAQRQANAAVLLAQLGELDSVWPVLEYCPPDPRLRSYAIHRLRFGIDLLKLLEQIDHEKEESILRGLILTLGEFSDETGAFTDSSLKSSDRAALIEKLLKLFTEERKAGLHAATEWLLRKLNESARLEEAVDRLKQNAIHRLKQDESQFKEREVHGGEWYVNTQGQTFVVLDPGDVLIGSPASELGRDSDEYEGRQRKRIRRRIAIATHEVTRAQYSRFQEERPHVGPIGRDKELVSQWVKTDDSPQVFMNWYQAAEYCNWLSEKEGIGKDQWFYQPNEDELYAAGMNTRENAESLIGYRLPTEAEWEYACRAETTTSRYYGSAETLLTHYAIHVQNGESRAWPVGSRKPNDFGLFDMLGNVSEWCHGPCEEHSPDGDSVTDDILVPVDDASRVCRGGAYNFLGMVVRAALRGPCTPYDRGTNVGFRVARTLPELRD
jgi:serine/threonine protein kinase/formylglycine-generating enzyme required for sulfatase activity